MARVSDFSERHVVREFNYAVELGGSNVIRLYPRPDMGIITDVLQRLQSPYHIIGIF